MSAEPMQRLGGRRPHSTALAGREHDGRKRASVHGPIVHLLADFARTFPDKQGAPAVNPSPTWPEVLARLRGQPLGAEHHGRPLVLHSDPMSFSGLRPGLGRPRRDRRELPGCSRSGPGRDPCRAARSTSSNVRALLPPSSWTCRPPRAPRLASSSLMYGHLDKQPPLGSWREGLDPFVARAGRRSSLWKGLRGRRLLHLRRHRRPGNARGDRHAARSLSRAHRGERGEWQSTSRPVPRRSRCSASARRGRGSSSAWTRDVPPTTGSGTRARCAARS